MIEEAFLFFRLKASPEEIKEFIAFQNANHERSVASWTLDRLKTLEREGETWVAVPVNNYFAAYPVINFIPRTIFFAALWASFKWQRKHKGKLLPLSTRKVAAHAAECGVFQ